MTVRTLLPRCMLLAPTLLALVACPEEPSEKPSDSSGLTPADLDEDGFTEDVDCDDADEDTHPEATERCDGIDNDCDALIDAEDPGLAAEDIFPDEDGDGYGDDAGQTTGCPDGSAWITESGDCDDADEEVHPGARDLEDGVDSDCDGSVDEDDEEPETPWEYGYFVAGRWDGDWTCVSYYGTVVKDHSEENLCEGCDYSRLIYAEHIPEKTALAECEWDTYEYWGEIESFYSLWGFSEAPAAYGYPVAYYYADAYGYWSRAVPLVEGESYYGYSYLSWTWFDEASSAGGQEIGIFLTYVYEGY